MIEMNDGDQPIEANPLTSVKEMKRFPCVKFIGDNLESGDRIEGPITNRTLDQIFEDEDAWTYDPEPLTMTDIGQTWINRCNDGNPHFSPFTKPLGPLPLKYS